MSYLVKEACLTLPDSGKSVKFDFPIRDVVEVGAVYVVCLRVEPPNRLTDNVWAVDVNGRVLWRSRTGRKSPYVGITLDTTPRKPPQHCVWLHNQDGTRYLVDANTGVVLRDVPSSKR